MLSGSAGNSPSIRRAARESDWVSISPLTSSSDWSVDACAARVDVTWSRMGRPRARVTLLDAPPHPRPYTPDVEGIDGGGSDAGRADEDEDDDDDARGVYVFHSPV